MPSLCSIFWISNCDDISIWTKHEAKLKQKKLPGASDFFPF